MYVVEHIKIYLLIKIENNKEKMKQENRMSTV